MDALGLELLGPQHPAGRRTEPAPTNLPADARNVATYHTTSQSPETATKQLDWAFASRGFHHSISVSALNSVEDWGPSDHCRLLIEVAGGDLRGGCMTIMSLPFFSGDAASVGVPLFPVARQPTLSGKLRTDIVALDEGGACA